MISLLFLEGDQIFISHDSFNKFFGYFPKWNEWKSRYLLLTIIEQGHFSNKTNFVLASYYFWRRLLIQGFRCFHVVREPWISDKPCEIHKTCKIPQTVLEILPNTCCHYIFETSNIFELTLAVGAVYLP